MQYVIGFVVGIASSIVGSLLLSGGRAFWRNVMNVFFRKLYPSINGRYDLIVPDDCMEYPDDKTILELRQFGAKVTGVMTFYEHGAVQDKILVEGKITPSRYLTFNYEAPNANHNQYGSGLYRLENNGMNLNGYISYICIHCEKAYSAESKLNRIADRA